MGYNERHTIIGVIKMGTEKIMEVKDVKKEGFDKLKKRVKTTGKLFKDGFVAQVTDPRTITSSTLVGIQQGMKYKGDVVRGVKAGAVTLGALGAVNGVVNVLNNLPQIKKVD